jgi:hypothetical protein
MREMVDREVERQQIIRARREEQSCKKRRG